MPVPATGTFKVYPDTISLVDVRGFSHLDNYIDVGTIPQSTTTAIETYLRNGGEAWVNFASPVVVPYAGIDPPDADAELPYPDTYYLELFPDTSAIIFNPGTVDEQIVDILSGDFPSGFGATNIRVKFEGMIFSNLAGAVNSISLRYFGGVIYTQLNPAIGSLTVPVGGATGDLSSDVDGIVPVGTYFNAAQTFKSFGLQAIFNDSGAGRSEAVFLITKLELYGDYVADSSSIISATPTSDLNAGDEITITDPQDRLLDATNIYQDTLIGTERVRTPVIIVSRTARTIVIRLPRGVTPNDELVVLIEGTSFTGEVPAAVLSPLLSDAEGAYKLTPGQRYDVFYDRTDPLNVITIESAIPTPFARTGYF